MDINSLSGPQETASFALGYQYFFSTKDEPITLYTSKGIREETRQYRAKDQTDAELTEAKLILAGFDVRLTRKQWGRQTGYILQYR